MSAVGSSRVTGSSVNDEEAGPSPIRSLTDTMDDWSIQDTDERRQIRQRYHEMLQDMQQPDEQSIENLKTKLNEAHDLFTKVRLPREAALDSKLLRQLSTAALRKAEALDTNMVSFDPSDFVTRLATFVSNNDIGRRGDDDGPMSSQDWKKFGQKMLPLFKSSPTFSLMFGSFPRALPPPPVKKQRQRMVKELEKDEKVNVPQKIKEMGKSEHELTTEEVEKVLQHLYRLYEKNGRNAMCLFEFTCHPTSFTQTIQNIFHVAFLVKDGYATIYLDDEELPVIEPVERSQDQSSGSTRQEPSDRKEFVLSISRPEWEQIVKVFKIKYQLIPSKTTAGRPPQ